MFSRRAALVVSLLLAATAARAAPVSLAYHLQPGELDVSYDSTALGAGGFGTVSPAQGLLGLTLTLGGRSFAQNSDPQFPTFPAVTLVNSALSFASFNPTSGGTSFSFLATAPGAEGTAFDYTFTGSDGTSITGSGIAGTSGGGSTVPEPATVGLLAAGLLAAASLRRRARG